MLKRLLVLVFFTGVIGSAEVLANDQAPGILAPAVPASFRSVGGIAIPQSLSSDIRSPNVVDTPPGDVTSANADAAMGKASPTSLTAPANGVSNGLPGAQIQGFVAAGKPSLRDRNKGNVFQFLAGVMPEPADWMLLLCGAVIAGFIARRKLGWMSGR